MLKTQRSSTSKAQLMGLLIMLSITSCDGRCSNPDVSEERDTSTLTLAIDKTTLQGDEKSAQLSIKNPQQDHSALLKEFGLKISSQETGGTGTTIAYGLTDRKGNKIKVQEIDKPLTHFTSLQTLEAGASLTIPLQINPGPEVSKVVTTIILYKRINSEHEEILETKTVTWSQALPIYTISLVGIADNQQLHAEQEIGFHVQNEGDELSTEEITVYLDGDGVELNLGSQNGTIIKESLDRILNQPPRQLAKSDKTDKLTLKVANANGKTTANLTLELKKGSTSLIKRPIPWRAENINLQLKDVSTAVNSVNTKTVAVPYRVANIGVDQAVGDKISLRITRESGTSATLAGATDTSPVTLGNATLAIGDIKGETASTTQHLILDPQGETEPSAEFKLELLYDDEVVATEQVTWRPIRLAFKDLDKLVGSIENKAVEIKYQVQNTGTTTIVENKVSLRIKKLTQTTRPRWSMDRGANGATLAGAADDAPVTFNETTLAIPVLGPGETSEAKSLELNPGVEAKQAKFELALLYDGEVVATEKVTWGPIRPIFKGLSNSVVSINTEPVEIDYQIENIGTATAAAGKLSLKITRESGTSATLAGATDTSPVTLDNATLAIGDIKGKTASTMQHLTLDPQGETEPSANFKLELCYDGEVVFIENVTWTAIGSKLSFSNEFYSEVTRKFSFAVENKGNSQADTIKVYYTRIAGQATINGQTSGEIELGSIPQNSYSAEQTLEISFWPSGSQSAEFRFELIFEGATAATITKKFEKPNIVLERQLINYDWETGQATYQFINKGKDPAQDLVLHFKNCNISNQATISGATEGHIDIDLIEVKKVKEVPKEVCLNIDFNGEPAAKFDFEVYQGNRPLLRFQEFFQAIMLGLKVEQRKLRGDSKQFKFKVAKDGNKSLTIKKDKLTIKFSRIKGQYATLNGRASGEIEIAQDIASPQSESEEIILNLADNGDQEAEFRISAAYQGTTYTDEATAELGWSL